MRVDEDADHDRVADGADHDGADEGADARLVDADRVGGRLVVGSEDVLRCVSYGLYDSAVMTEGDREGPDALGGGDELETRVGGPRFTQYSHLRSSGEPQGLLPVQV